MRKLLLSLALAATLLSAVPAAAGQKAPGTGDKCAVCGMFVYKYPEWVASLGFKDGSHVFFDGAKDMFKFYFDVEKYAPSRRTADVEEVWVKEYYGLMDIDGRTAVFVVGSDVMGPMGRELIPFKDMEDAAAFMKDHSGTRALKFGEVTREAVLGLDR